MKNTIDNWAEIANRHIPGFHQYVFTDPIHLGYVSRNLCDMVGFEENELLSESKDLYAALVHPADRERYAQFLRRVQAKVQALTCEYRLMRKDGTALYISDTITSEKREDGTLVGYSVLTDITAIKNENRNLRFLNETVPCGFLKYTCEKQPKVTYINKRMRELLRIPEARDGEMDYMEMYKDNLFLMIPMEERRRFASYLDRVYTAGAPIAGDMSILRCDGTKAHIFGWGAKCTNEQGAEEFQSVCIDVTERHQAKKADAAKRYLKALTDIYDKVFEYDLANNTVNCLYSNNSPMFKWLEKIPMQMQEATEKWITDTVVQEERERVRSFFQAFCQKKLYKPGEKPPQIAYRAKSSSGEIKTYSGIFLKMDDFISLYCCRCIPDTQEADALRNENVSLKENIQELVMQFTEGIAALEVSGQYVTPLYASENVCRFFGVRQEEWLPLMNKSTPLKDFVARSSVAYEDFAELLQSGEAEFTYYDVATESQRHIKAICSPKSPAASPRYVLLFNMDEAGAPKGGDPSAGKRVSIRTFGYFDVFVDGKPIAFRNKKSKELFALLVDRRGGYVSSEEAISFLWEDEPVNSVTLARYRKVALRLKNILAEYGISDVVESVDGKRRIEAEKVKCDLYDYLSGKPEYSQLFKGSYLTNYSWGETTLAELTGKIVY
ncbi:MAG TPA: PAS domain-containing protein [Firmicutes bacterium]|nr:PAS domain-containing protein [Bacillota bacterium]